MKKILLILAVIFLNNNCGWNKPLILNGDIRVKRVVVTGECKTANCCESDNCSFTENGFWMNDKTFGAYVEKIQRCNRELSD